MMLNGLQRAFPKACERELAGVIPTRSSPGCYGKDSGRAMKDRRQKNEEGRRTLIAGVERGNGRLVEFMALDCRGATRLQDVRDGGVQDFPALPASSTATKMNQRISRYLGNARQSIKHSQLIHRSRHAGYLSNDTGSANARYRFCPPPQTVVTGSSCTRGQSMLMA